MCYLNGPAPFSLCFVTWRRFKGDNMFDEGKMNLDERKKFSFNDSDVRLLDGHHRGLAVGQEKVSPGLVPA